MTYILFLDDIRSPRSTLKESANIDMDVDDRKVVVARHPKAFVNVLEEHGCPQHIAFDHDLGPFYTTGYDMAKQFCWMIMNGQLELRDDFNFSVHSMNPIGAENIRAYLRNFLNRYREISSETEDQT